MQLRSTADRKQFQLSGDGDMPIETARTNCSLACGRRFKKDCYPKQQAVGDTWTRKPLAKRESNQLMYLRVANFNLKHIRSACIYTISR